MTLPIPPWTRDIRADGWVNIHDLLEPTRLSGVDSFLGDPRAHTLILGQDFGSEGDIRQRQRKGHPDPFSRLDDCETNGTLESILQGLGFGSQLGSGNATSCGLYYANAIYLLREGDLRGGDVATTAALRASEPVLRHILACLPRPLRIIAMGEKPFHSLARLYDRDARWREHLERRDVLAIRQEGLRIFATSHLSGRGVTNRCRGAKRSACLEAIVQDWKAAFAQ